MFPAYPVLNSPRMHGRNSKALAYFTTRLCRVSDGMHLLCGKLGTFMSFSVGVIGSSFAHHIANIISWCAQKQVRKIYTTGIIATVAHKHVFRYSAVKNTPSKSMCSYPLTIERHSTITIAIMRTFKQQTLFIAGHTHG